jgi:hypothetical protein
MPEYTFDGHCLHTYPVARDAKGRHIGEAEPGDIRELDAPLDHMWHLTTDEDRAAMPSILAARERARDEERFAGHVRQLRDMGLGAASLAEITEAGVPEGLTAAEGLLRGGVRAVQQLNRQQAAMQQAAAQELPAGGSAEQAGAGQDAGPPPGKQQRRPRNPDSDQAGDSGTKEA